MPEASALRAAKDSRGEREPIDTSFDGYMKYVARSAKESFGVIRGLAKEISDVELPEPEIIFKAKAPPDMRHAVAVYRRHDGETGKDNVIIVYNQMYRGYAEMMEDRANGITNLTTDWVVAHELGHELVHLAIFEKGLVDRSLNGSLAFRKLNESSAELIGAYVARMVNGMPINNQDVAVSLLQYVHSNFASGADAQGGRLDDLVNEAETHRYDPQVMTELVKEISDVNNLIDKELTYYASPTLGFAKLLLEERTAPLAELLKLAFMHPEDAPGIMEVVPNREEEDIFESRKHAAYRNMDLVRDDFEKYVAANGLAMDVKEIARFLNAEAQENEEPTDKDIPSRNTAFFIASVAMSMALLAELRAKAGEAKTILDALEHR